MKIRQVVFLFTLLWFSFFVVGSDGGEIYTESVQTFEVSGKLVSDNNLRLLSFTSDEYYWGDQEKEIRLKLEAMINGGEYNIVSVKTVYLSGYLTSADVISDVSGRGDGNDIRVMFVTTNKYYDERGKEMRLKLDAMTNNEKYDVVKVHTVYKDQTIYEEEEHLLAAEVYYREKK